MGISETVAEKVLTGQDEAPVVAPVIEPESEPKPVKSSQKGWRPDGVNRKRSCRN